MKSCISATCPTLLATVPPTPPCNIVTPLQQDPDFWPEEGNVHRAGSRCFTNPDPSIGDTNEGIQRLSLNPTRTGRSILSNPVRNASSRAGDARCQMLSLAKKPNFSIASGSDSLDSRPPWFWVWYYRLSSGQGRPDWDERIELRHGATTKGVSACKWNCHLQDATTMPRRETR